MAEGSAATKTRKMMPQVTTAGPDCHKIPSTGGTFLSASIRSRHALREDCGLASVMKFDSLERTRPLRRLDNWIPIQCYQSDALPRSLVGRLGYLRSVLDCAKNRIFKFAPRERA